MENNVLDLPLHHPQHDRVRLASDVASKVETAVWDALNTFATDNAHQPDGVQEGLAEGLGRVLSSFDDLVERLPRVVEMVRTEQKARRIANQALRNVKTAASGSRRRVALD